MNNARFAKTRGEAAAAGNMFYRTGRSCSNGHSEKRYTSNGLCIECNRALNRAYAKTPKGVTTQRKHRRTSGAKDWHRLYSQRPAVMAARRAKRKERLRTDLIFKARRNVSGRLYKALRGYHRSATTMELIGCSPAQLIAHIEAQFPPGMTWAAWGPGFGRTRQWHIDHIRPLASFDLTDSTQLAVACHFTNLQPLWAEENVSKGVRICGNE